MTEPPLESRSNAAVITGPAGRHSTGGLPAYDVRVTGQTTGDGLLSVPRPAGGQPPSRYAITGTLGEGGTSVVYSASDQHLGREVAVKVFKQAISGEDSSRQQVEIDVLAALNHHAVVTLIDAGIAPDPDGIPHRYLVLEHVDGLDLRRHIETAPLTLRQIAEIGSDLAEALEYVHARGVIHRDLKPGNILIVSDDENSGRTGARLTDFGIALASGMERATMDGMTTGTAAYLSPEQARGDDLTGASDVYALGLVLLECYTRVLAFPGNPVQSALARLRDDPPIPDDLPEDWRMLLRAMTAREPAERPVGRELAEALRQLEIGESSKHRADPVVVPESALDRAYERITGIAARAFDVPVAVLRVSGAESVNLLSYRGLSEDVAGRWPFPLDGDELIVQDALVDFRLRTHEVVATGEVGIRFYAGVAVRSGDGSVIGCLSVGDRVPHAATDGQLETLRDLAELATLLFLGVSDGA